MVEWALMGGPLDVRRFICVAPGLDHFRHEDVNAQLASAVRRRVRGVFVVGKDDWVLEPVIQFHEATRSAAISLRLDVVPGVDRLRSIRSSSQAPHLAQAVRDGTARIRCPRRQLPRSRCHGRHVEGEHVPPPGARHQ